MRFSFGKVLMAIGLVCLIGASAFVVRNYKENQAAGEQSDAYLKAMAAQIPDGDAYENVDYPTSGDMPAVDIDGASLIGSITIPALGLDLPIQRDWASKAARKSPCRYKGSVYTDDLIVAGHNYDRHFGRLKDLVSGDTIIVTDVDGRSFYYTVTYTEILDTYDVDGMDAGDWDFTVFTCTIGGASRVTVRCDFTGRVVANSDDVAISF